MMVMLCGRRIDGPGYPWVIPGISSVILGLSLGYPGDILGYPQVIPGLSLDYPGLSNIPGVSGLSPGYPRLSVGYPWVIPGLSGGCEASYPEGVRPHIQRV